MFTSGERVAKNKRRTEGERQNYVENFLTSESANILRHSSSSKIYVNNL